MLGIMMCISSIIFVQNRYIPDEIETNHYATLKNEFELAAIDQNYGFCDLLLIRFRILKEGVSVKLVQKFYAFLILQSFIPMFTDYDYYFQIDVMKITQA